MLALSFVIYLILAGAVLQGMISLIEGFRAARHLETWRPRVSRFPVVTVFCACKGTDDPGFEENIRSILDQDYAARHTVFVVESESDPAFAALKALGAASVLVAGESVNRGQKVHNLIHGTDRAPEDTEVFVFCDVDGRYPRHWISHLIAPLEDEAVGASTGYRWYAAETGSLPSLLRSIWNASAVTLLGPHDRNFVWGGSMAMRRSVFDRIGIRKAWEGAVSDDYAVTQSVRAAGMRIEFVPMCLIPAYGDCSWGELFEFTTRQIVITRVYEPRLWRLAFFSQTFFNVAFWSGWFVFWPASLTLYVLAGIKGHVRYRAVSKVLPRGALSKHRWSYILFPPLIAVLYQYNLIRSAFTRTIRWRRIRYSLISPDRTVVQRGAGES